MKAGLSVVDPSHPVDYATSQTPPSYVCGDCGAARCKLWREYNTFDLLGLEGGEL